MTLNRFYHGYALIVCKKLYTDYECMVKEVETERILKLGTYPECLAYFREITERRN